MSSPQPERAEADVESGASSAASSATSAWVVALGALAGDAAAVFITASLLWLGAGATVFQGSPGITGMAFAIGAVLLACVRLTVRRVMNTSAYRVSYFVWSAAVLCAAVYLYHAYYTNYFFAWVTVLGAAYVTVRAVLTIVVAFATERRESVLTAVMILPFGVVSIALLRAVWQTSGFLADLAVFAVLLTVAAWAIALGIGLYQQHRRTAVKRGGGGS